MDIKPVEDSKKEYEIQRTRARMVQTGIRLTRQGRQKEIADLWGKKQYSNAIAIGPFHDAAVFNIDTAFRLTADYIRKYIIERGLPVPHPRDATVDDEAAVVYLAQHCAELIVKGDTHGALLCITLGLYNPLRRVTCRVRGGTDAEPHARTPLEVAVEYANVDVCAALLSHPALIKGNVNESTNIFIVAMTTLMVFAEDMNLGPNPTLDVNLIRFYRDAFVERRKIIFDLLLEHSMVWAMQHCPMAYFDTTALMNTPNEFTVNRVAFPDCHVMNGMLVRTGVPWDADPDRWDTVLTAACQIHSYADPTLWCFFAERLVAYCKAKYKPAICAILLDAQNSTGMSPVSLALPLHKDCSDEEYDAAVGVLRSLHAAGADFNTESETGRNDYSRILNVKRPVATLTMLTPLSMACRGRAPYNMRLAEVLIGLGADVNSKNIDDETELTLACLGSKVHIRCYAINADKQCDVISMLLFFNARPHGRCYTRVCTGGVFGEGRPFCSTHIGHMKVILGSLLAAGSPRHIHGQVMEKLDGILILLVLRLLRAGDPLSHRPSDLYHDPLSDESWSEQQELLAMLVEPAGPFLEQPVPYDNATIARIDRICRGHRLPVYKLMTVEMRAYLLKYRSVSSRFRRDNGPHGAPRKPA